jgi:hypothetical protein
MKHKDLETLFNGRIVDESILCTDSHKSSIQFTQTMGIELKQIDHVNVRKARIIYNTSTPAIANQKIDG